MRHISILVPKVAILGSLEGSRQLFSQVNEFCKVKGHPPLFKVQLVGLSSETMVSGGLFTVNTNVTIKDIEKTNLFPEVNLVTEKIITDEQGIYSSGGAFSYLNLILYLIEKYAGREIAVLSAKVFAIELDRENQLSFTIFQGQKGHEDEPIKKVQEFIENNFSKKITIDQLAAMQAIGRRNLERRFKKATANTIVEYIQGVKMEAAKISLESSRENVNEVMYKVGYTDTKAFRTTFKRITGLSPIQYRTKYNRAIAV